MSNHTTPTNTPSRLVVTLVCTIFLYASILAPVHAQQHALPEIGDPSGGVLTPFEEKKLGQAFMRSIRKTMNLLSDPLANSYIQSLGNRLAEQTGSPAGSYNFFIIDDLQVNAFAGPGGNIGVYTGLITTTESESELASVMAHEIAHISQRHLVRTYDAVSRMNLPAAALMLAAMVIGAAAKNPDAAVAAATGIQAGMIQRQINFTRSHEEEADSIGIQILASANFEPRSMPVFFDRMGKATRMYNTGKLPEFLRTHPVTSNRIADAHGRADQYPYRQRPDSLEYHLLRAQLKAASFSNEAEAVRYFKSSLQEGRYRNEEGQRYGYVQSLIAARDLESARKQLDLLLKQRPQQIDYIVLDALLLKKSGQTSQSIETLKDGLVLYPGNYPLSIYLSRALLDTGRPGDAIPLLEDQLHGHPDDTALYKLLAQAAGDSGDATLGRSYLAEYHYHSGDLEKAIQQLQQALSDRKLDYYSSAKLAARLKLVRQEQADLKKRSK
ncbi:MAG: M48 family metalloprotease [Candidatus Sedimenticola sp. 20ELBAFRAG]